VNGPGVRERTRVGVRARVGPREAISEMAKKESRFSIARSVQAFQENVSQAGPAAGASYSLIGAILVLGGAGYAVDRWLGWAPWGVFGGLMLGFAAGFYGLVKAVRR
jgi:ATP synthase protein I